MQPRSQLVLAGDGAIYERLWALELGVGAYMQLYEPRHLEQPLCLCSLGQGLAEPRQGGSGWAEVLLAPGPPLQECVDRGGHVGLHIVWWELGAAVVRLAVRGTLPPRCSQHRHQQWEQRGHYPRVQLGEPVAASGLDSERSFKSQALETNTLLREQGPLSRRTSSHLAAGRKRSTAHG